MVKGIVELSVMSVITLASVPVKFFQGQKMAVNRYWISYLSAFAFFGVWGQSSRARMK